MNLRWYFHLSGSIFGHFFSVPLVSLVLVLPRLIEGDARSDSDVDGVNEVLVEDPAIVCRSELSAAETNRLGRTEVNQGWRA